MLEDMQPPRLIKATKIEKIADGLNETDRKIFLDALENLDWSGPQLSKALGERGVNLSATAIHRYRMKRGILR